MTTDVKRCSKCKCEKPLSEFGKHKARPDGLTVYCLPCKRQAKRETDDRHRYRVRADNRERMRRRYRENAAFREADNARSREYRAANLEKARADLKRYYEENKAAFRAHNAKRRAGIQQRACLLTPEDAKKIEALYGFAQYLTEKFGKPHHVDHIVPLFGKTASGLHHPDNLRVVPAQLNLSKSNKIDYELVPHAFRPEEN